MKVYQYNYYPSGQLEPVIAVCQAENRDEALAIFKQVCTKGNIEFHDYYCREVIMNDFNIGIIKTY